MILLSAYHWLTRLLEPVFYAVLYLRKRKGKEHKTRMAERTGVAGTSRPVGDLIWLHAASVGEAQSALILVDRLLKALPKHAILITSGTVTSANMLAGKLPGGVIHQFYPLDHPRFCQRFWRTGSQRGALAGIRALAKYAACMQGAGHPDGAGECAYVGGLI